MTNPTAPLPLQGIKVIDYSHFLAGPFLSRQLAALGADVIKVERPRAGDAGRASPTQREGVSGYFLQQNMGKRGLCLDLRQPQAVELMKRLAATADVFVENYRPGALKKLGLGYEELSELNPRLIYASVSAFGHSGPLSERPGFGLIAEAMSGAMSIVGTEGAPPPLFRMPLADMYTGSHGATAVLAAIISRMQTGRGQHVDLALYDCMVSMHDYALQGYLMSDGAEMPKRTGDNLPDSTVYGCFSAPDGDLVIAAQVDDTWLKLAHLIGGEALAADVRFHGAANRNDHNAEAIVLVRAWCAAQSSRAAALAALDAAGVPAAPIQTIAEVANDPQVAARNMVLEQDHPKLGKVKVPNLPFKFSGLDLGTPVAAPGLGEHNRDLALELGFSDAEVDAMLESGALYTSAD
ncbi:crotonobetainyl-CoA:carnitine CoA-transferase CaiB-like acyl-CoA transferase [Rhodobacter aestuarii]|uniref:Crotonobetainyl-CoA:carnitine CoA-transferase CaiB n=1 Tax=Rhodobacter aestuarii TaxID=453582 RepID=A0A1N7PKN5_9RHOB|nr:CoA transferase [Rhodobacter aestuarii]PTV94339.1 crotonobetainyl-CoA:carnitine CoA-transferase CaiB-like acyl-CoA transferase [Rhodobacter aestuarii]SIT11185.1 Crotonobetainyl-CoA:carnitine CoA-transferase CaiB [Rhodobacter aestuarii]